MKRPVVQLESLSKTFRRKGGELVSAVEDVSLDILPGEMIVLLGPSGCGKTSLLRCIGGLEEPDGGEITLAGRKVFGRGVKPVPPESRGIGMMFQSYALWPHMTVARNVSYPLEARRMKRAEINERVQRILELAGISHLAAQYPGNLSGGQQQRVALVRSLVAEPGVILFDEPLSNVDAKVRVQLRAEIRGMQERLGFAGIYVTHDQEEALQLADRIAVMRAGQVVEIGRPDEVYNRPRSRYTAQFLGDLNLITMSRLASEGEYASFDHEELGRVYLLKRGTRNYEDGLAVGFRPERVKMSAAPHSGEPVNHWRGRVEHVTFSGAWREYRVRIGKNTVLTVKAIEDAAHTSRDIGDDVYLTIDPIDISVLEDDVAEGRP